MAVEILILISLFIQEDGLVHGIPVGLPYKKTLCPKGAIECDMMLTREQKRNNKLKKAINGDERFRWPNDGPDGDPLVPYVFDDSVSQSKVKAGIDHWEKHTCIKFVETNNTNQPHLKFIQDKGCWSYIGRIWWWKGQKISIPTGCEKLGVVVHEIGHAIGFFHEQSRQDRDDYVIILLDNVMSGHQHNFNKLNENNYSVPYDYSSVMHYGTFFFSKSGYYSPTLLTIDPMAQELIRNREGLTHRDMLTANRMYNCTGKWLTKCGLTSDPCKNDGYIGRNCSCVCPTGTIGDYCEVIVEDYYAHLRNPQSERIYSEETINISLPLAPGAIVVKWITPPPCKYASVYFIHEKMFEDCFYQFLNIRTDPWDYYGQRKCYENIDGLIISSEWGVVITMYSYVNYGSWSDITFWKAKVTFVDIPNCSTSTQTSSQPTKTTTSTSASTSQSVTYSPLTSTIAPTPRTPTTCPPTPASCTCPPTPTPTTCPPTPAPCTCPPIPTSTICPTPLPCTCPTNPSTIPTTTITPNIPCRYNAFKVPQDMEIERGTSITITSPGYPRKYPSKEFVCGWKLETHNNAKLGIYCDTYKLARKDALKINGKPFRQFKSSHITTSRMVIAFRSKKNNIGDGFSCRVVSS